MFLKIKKKQYLEKLNLKNCIKKKLKNNIKKI